MEKVLEEKINTKVKLCVSRFAKFYLEETAMVEIVKCIVNADTGAIIRQDFVQNRVFSNKGFREFDMIMKSIKELGEEKYFKQLLDVVEKEIKESGKQKQS